MFKTRAGTDSDNLNVSPCQVRAILELISNISPETVTATFVFAVVHFPLVASISTGPGRA